MNNRIQMGLEYELQLMVEDEDGLKVVSAEMFLDRQYNLLPQCTTFDFGNIEISTPPRESYKEAVEIANYILTDKLVPALINNFKLEKFALFLPTPMCKFYYNEEPVYHIRNKKRVYAGAKIQIIRPNEEVCCLKDWDIPYGGRVHIKIPYHYSPINGNPNLLPDFKDILLPPDRGWKNLVCFYKDNNFVKVRDLI